MQPVYLAGRDFHFLSFPFTLLSHSLKPDSLTLQTLLPFQFFPLYTLSHYPKHLSLLSFLIYLLSILKSWYGTNNLPSVQWKFQVVLHNLSPNEDAKVLSLLLLRDFKTFPPPIFPCLNTVFTFKNDSVIAKSIMVRM